jgi:isopentenyl phosphate kinase
MGRVILKWGGGLITDKSQLCTPRIDRLEALSTTITTLTEQGHDIILVHGAGSYGHLRAKEARLAEGRIDELEQSDAIHQVRSDMDELHSLVIDSLHVDGMSHAPRDFVTNTGAGFNGDLSAFETPGLHLTFGDVVPCDPPQDFGILSGDDLMLRLAIELPDVTHVIFAMGDVPGLMTGPGADAELIAEWSASEGLVGAHATEQDVTGGIFLKAERASVIASTVDHVWFVDGRQPSRILAIVNGGRALGTRIRP